ncbi:MAG: M56 family metallopeptidase [Gemmatimonadetes bacterium]|nr:M56 family metallopeptidase [Gemmatimonadota bacterium]
MNLLIYLAEAWWPLYAVHFVEVSLFILLVWAVDRWMTLDTRLRYVLYLLALAKVFVPPFYAIPLPEFLAVSDDVPIGPVYAGVVSEAEVVAPVQVAPLPLAFYLFCLWGVSVLVWAGVTLWKNAAFHRALSLAVPVDLAREVGSLNEAQDIKVYAKASLRSPLLVGIVKPRLYLPAHWSSWSPEELRGVVAHELAHRDNRDIWVLIFQAIAMALFCINPLVWLLNRRLAFLRELRCDEAVLRETNLTPAEYGRLLFGFVDRRPALSALYFNERGTALKKRLEYVLNFKEDNVKRSRWQLAIPILIGLAIVPFSIREAYTHDENDLEVIELVEDEKKPEPTPEQPTTPPASDDADSREFIELTEVEEKIETEETPEMSRKAILINDVIPVYPGKAIRGQVEGTVSLRFLINVDGSVSDVRILKGPEIFHQAVIEAVSQWRFKPAKHDGKAMPAWMMQQFKFERSELELASELFYSVSFIPPIAIGNGEELVGGSQSSRYALYALESEQQQAALAKFIEAKQNFKPKQQNASSASADADSSKVLEFFMVEAKPKLLHSVKPVHPEEAIRDSLEGKVFLKFIVNVDGLVSDVTVLRTIGPEVFRQAAIDAISQFQFKPAEHNGKSVAVWMTQLIKFGLPKE